MLFTVRLLQHHTAVWWTCEIFLSHVLEQSAPASRAGRRGRFVVWLGASPWATGLIRLITFNDRSLFVKCTAQTPHRQTLGSSPTDNSPRKSADPRVRIPGLSE